MSAWLITHAPKPVSGLLSITHAQMSLHVAGVKRTRVSHAKSCIHVQFRNVSTLKQETFNSIDRRIMSSMSRIARVGSRILSAASGRSGSAATGEIITAYGLTNVVMWFVWLYIWACNFSFFSMPARQTILY